MDPRLFIISFCLSAALLFASQSLFLFKKRFDEFNHRSSHKTIATRNGGIAIFLTLFGIALGHYFFNVELFDYSLFIPLGVLFILGVYDDLYRADFKLKFLMQIVIAKIIIDQGFVIDFLHGFFGIYEIPWVPAQLLTAFIFILCVNAYNFIDGIDGLALSETLKNLLFFSFVLPQNDPLVTLALLLISSGLPLYYFNFKKRKKIFLGDAGSLFLGGINVLFLYHLLNPTTVTARLEDVNRLLIALVVVIYPILDLLRVVLIRFKNKTSPFSPDQNHLHHWFLAKGLSHFKTTAILTTFGAFLLTVLFWI